jgi:hypothetical protein
MLSPFLFWAAFFYPSSLLVLAKESNSISRKEQFNFETRFLATASQRSKYMWRHSTVSYCSLTDSISFHVRWRKIDYKRAPRGHFYNSNVFNANAVPGNRRVTCQLAGIDFLTVTSLMRRRVLTSHRILKFSPSPIHDPRSTPFHRPQKFLWMYHEYPWRFVRWSRPIISYTWRDSPQWAMAPSFTRFLDHPPRHTTLGRNPLDE